jgi:hypothetical protein
LGSGGSGGSGTSGASASDAALAADAGSTVDAADAAEAADASEAPEATCGFIGTGMPGNARSGALALDGTLAPGINGGDAGVDVTCPWSTFAGDVLRCKPDGALPFEEDAEADSGARRACCAPTAPAYATSAAATPTTIALAPNAVSLFPARCID